MGLSRAGFDVTGVDIKPQKHYPFKFIQADALTVDLDGYDAYWASPPCQHYSSATRDRSLHPDLYVPTRKRLQSTGKPFILENVIGAPYETGIILCGSMFNLSADGEWIERHRNFETSWMIFQPECHHPLTPRAVTVTGKSFTAEVREYKHSRQCPYALAEKLMGIDWMDRAELTQAIPPAYSEFLGKQLMKNLEAKADGVL